MSATAVLLGGHILTTYKVITNEGDQNQVIAASINADGTLVRVFNDTCFSVVS